MDQTNNPSHPSNSPPPPPQAPIPPAQPGVTPQPGSTNGLAIAGFVLAFLAPLIGLVLSIIGLVKAKDHGGKGQGLAIAGIVISVILIPISLAFWVAFYSGFTQKLKEGETNKSSTSQVANHDSDNDAIELGEIYKEKSGVYSIKLPSKWETRQPEGSRDLTAQPPISTEDYVSRLSVYVDKLYEGETFDEAVASDRKSTTEFSHGTIESESNTTINGLKGHESVYKEDSGGRVSSHYKVMVEKNGTLYAIEYETSPERSEAYLPVFKESAKSFIVL